MVTWRSKNQSVVAKSTTTIEFKALAQGICDLLWIKRLLGELNMAGSRVAMKLYSDNKAAINIAHNPIHHDRTKHVEIDLHFIKENIEKGEVCIVFITTAQQVVDVLTQGITRDKFEALTSKLGMLNIYALA